MFAPWRFEIWRALLILTIAFLVGGASGHILASISIVLAGYVVFFVYQVRRLEKWLNNGMVGKEPSPSGIWEAIYYQIYKIGKGHRRGKRTLAKLLTRFQKTIAALPDGAVVLGSQNQIEWYNKAAGHWLGLKPIDQMQHISNFLRHPDFTHYLNKDHFTSPITISSPVLTNCELEIRIIPYGKKQRLVLIRDITELQATERMRHDFIANASHELRTPLTVIQGHLDLLKEDFGNDETGTHKSLDKIEQQIGHMNRLVKDLLTLSRLEGKQKKELEDSIDVPAMVKEIRAEAIAQSNNKNHQITLEIKSTHRLLADAVEIKSAFTNLVSNAVHYTPAEGKISLRWHEQDGAAVFEVEDNGIGIPRVHLPRIAERFYRVNTRQSEYHQGTGLGLAIVKHVLSRYGAELRVSSEPEKGSVFSCCFPLGSENSLQSSVVTETS